MPSVDDQLATGQTDFKAAAAAGVNVLDHMAEFTFDLYDRVVLPLDGYVFWVKRTPTVVATTQITVQGSLHIGTTNSQDEAANISQSRVTFTALRQVDSLISAAPSTMWIFTVPSGPMAGLKCAFSMQGNYYKQADLFHYVGFALFADNATQVIDDPATLPSALYPSFLVPDNISPVSPYGAVDISSDGTEALQAAPLIDSTQSHYQLVHDQVRVTLYGGTNKQALDFVDCVNQYSLDYGTIGIMNVPVIRDAKRTQNEFNILGMKKIVSFDVSYYQDTVVSVARQLILKSVPSYVIT
jgi:hypothetical protein